MRAITVRLPHREASLIRNLLNRVLALVADDELLDFGRDDARPLRSGFAGGLPVRVVAVRIGRCAHVFSVRDSFLSGGPVRWAATI